MNLLNKMKNKIIDLFDRAIYYIAHRSFNRYFSNPVRAYILKLHIDRYTNEHPLDPKVKAVIEKGVIDEFQKNSN